MQRAACPHPMPRVLVGAHPGLSTRSLAESHAQTHTTVRRSAGLAASSRRCVSWPRPHIELEVPAHWPPLAAPRGHHAQPAVRDDRVLDHGGQRPRRVRVRAGTRARAGAAGHRHRQRHADEHPPARPPAASAGRAAPPGGRAHPRVVPRRDGGARSGDRQRPAPAGSDDARLRSVDDAARRARRVEPRPRGSRRAQGPARARCRSRARTTTPRRAWRCERSRRGSSRSAARSIS